MSRYKAYPEYKDSRVEFLGLIPKIWMATPIKHIGKLKGGAGFPHDEQGLNDKELDFHKVNALGKSFNYDFLERSENTISKVTAKKLGAFIFPKKSIIFAKVGAALMLARIRWLNYPACIDNNMMGLIVNENNNVNFIRYAMKIIKFDYVVNPGAIPSLNEFQIGNMFLGIPPLIEQQHIATFLDHQTAKIDTLIEKQKQLIKLLKEKRQAVISHAVTKGLNPNAPMRDSGVEWIDKIPEHWKFVPLKYLCKFSGGGTPSKENLSYWTGGNIPWVSPKDMRYFWLSDTQDKLTEKAVAESSTNFVESDTLLMVVRSGILQRTIPIAINTVRVTLNQDMKAIRFNSQINVEYAANFILGNQNSLLLEWSKEGATVESIEHEYLSNSLFPVPPIKEQKEINEFIKKRMDIFKNLEEYVAREMVLLKERRTALISAAVTGKIDVRDWQPPKTTPSSKKINKGYTT